MPVAVSFLSSRGRAGDPRGLAGTGLGDHGGGAIMIVVFGGFMLSPERFLQQFGLGLSAAVLIDAVVIRCVVVPAVMQLLGERAWWLPAWLHRRLPHIALERRQVRAAG